VTRPNPSPASPRLASRHLRWFISALVFAAALALPSTRSQAVAPAAPAQATAPSTSGALSPAEFESHLRSLEQLVASCQKAPANCQPDQVGLDLKIATPSGSRQVRLGWLRDLIGQAATGHLPKAETQKLPGAAEQKPDFPPPTLAQQLEDARQRLIAEDEAAGRLSAQPSANEASASQRQILTRILAANEYKAAVVRPSLLHQILEKIGNWLDRFFGRLREAGFRFRWIGLAAEIGFGLAVCIALVWFLIRLERNGRLGSFHTEPPVGVASARDWQLWLADAQKAAAGAAWRDAIHYLYWASISRLESSGLWPAARARTPREYLALLSRTGTERTGLAALTRSFERTWYAGRPAAEADFRDAEQMAAQLGARTASASAASHPQSRPAQNPQAQNQEAK
jgi:hypothetical protein